MKKIKKIDKGTITDVPGILASASHCGIRKKRKDVCIIHAPGKTSCSAVFTKNTFAAAPVLVCREKLKKNRNINTVVVNSGVANACTGEEGLSNSIETINFCGECLDLSTDNILVCSTGVIGEQLPMKKLKKGIRNCCDHLGANKGHEAAEAILTTDTVTKEVAVEFNSRKNSEKIIIGGIAKGSGMIEPNMATMLAFIGTNLIVDSMLLDNIIREAADKSFNSVTVDGCQSTNDTVIIIGNSSSGLEINNESDEDYLTFKEAVILVFEELAKMIVLDGEGASKFIEINVRGAKNDATARAIGKKIANSNLFKTAMYGEDINWGRINAAIGSLELNMDPMAINIYIGNILIVENGQEAVFNPRKAKAELKKDKITFYIDFKEGRGFSRVWTSDLSNEYIRINALYKT